LSRGSKIFFPVYVDGAGLSVGDLHFSQGDGEITFCGAIEMAGWAHMKVSIIKDGMAKYGIKNPIFKPSPIVPTYNDYVIFEGISVDESGKQYYLDVNVAYRQGLLERHRVPEEVRLLGRPGLFHPGHGPRAGPHQRRGRRAQRLRHAVAADADLRL
jgi:acetamidase/formamidase